jgi:energy-coupling factor transporter ATP-binding protein EcfA2
MDTINEPEHISFIHNFRPPIYYNAAKIKINENIKSDLELIDSPSNDESELASDNSMSVYNHLLHIDNNADENAHFYKQTHQQLSDYYTTDVDFLTDTQTLLQTYEPCKTTYNECEITKLWCDIKQDTGFKPRYNYMDWDILEPLNTSEAFLQGSGMYNIASPIISLCTPLIMLLVPLVLLKFRGTNIGLGEYIEVLKGIIGGHSISRMFTDFGQVPLKEQIYLLVSSSFYVFSIYQNIIACINFRKNMQNIYRHFKDLVQYLDTSILTMETFVKTTTQLETYKPFVDILIVKMNSLIEFRDKIVYITQRTAYSFSFNTFCKIGGIMKSFYELYKHDLYEDALMYSFGFNSYIGSIEGLQHNISQGHLSFATFKSKIGKNPKNVIVDSYYAPLKNQSHIKNTVSLDKSIILTGPNASGKTTLLKSVLINVILSQQFGVGCYESATLVPYSHIHCYLNIPDTSNRDSLFQAEARRCKHIIDSVQLSSPTETHLCGFDELYSGTNPEEAGQSTTALIKWLSKNCRVSCILTTHFTDVCTNLEKDEQVRNCHMQTNSIPNNENEPENNQTIQYKYKLMDGISFVKGGVSILRTMNYPDEIVHGIS